MERDWDYYGIQRASVLIVSTPSVQGFRALLLYTISENSGVQHAECYVLIDTSRNTIVFPEASLPTRYKSVIISDTNHTLLWNIHLTINY